MSPQILNCSISECEWTERRGEKTVQCFAQLWKTHDQNKCERAKEHPDKTNLA